ncbi:MAG: sigma-54-dependent Fis family transcriptional regulator [Planctomycetaceae bacterium]|nr:sigma-54-dependent Fis family transcriptional regulator [Planctomycetaceae bacterium]
MNDPLAVDLLLVEDDDEFRGTAAQYLTRKGHTVSECANGQDALIQLQRRRFDVAILDMNLPGISGLELLDRVREQQIETEILILTGQATVENAVEAMKRGAGDYLTKPFPLGELEQRCLLAAQRAQLRRENDQLRELLQREQHATRIVGNSPQMQEVFHLISRIAPTDKAVLIEGESGTGKELVARAVLEQSHRRGRPFVTINCAALPENLVESELFGHEKGAFTGAGARKQGLFEVAHGGTLFIDEIGELAPMLQPKLLRVLEDGGLRRVGSHQERRVNVRIIAATNRDLQQEVEAGRFREDLFYRLNVMSIKLPPLRDRTGDVDLLVQHLLGPGWEIEDDAQAALIAYHWPGNVRQLMNALDRAMILADDHVITIDDLPREVTQAVAQSPSPTRTASSTLGSMLDDDLASIERAHIVSVLKKEKGNKARAARALGIHRRKLYRLIERFGIGTEEAQAEEVK